jgi:regulatory protein
MAKKQMFRRTAKPRTATLDENSLWEYALRVLSQRAHSAGEIKRKLSRRADSPASVTAVMTKLGEYGLADDQKFSEMFASSRLQNSGFGRFRVLQDLRSKQVSSNTAEAAVNAVFSETDENQLIEQFLNRKYRKIELSTFLAEEKNLSSAYRRLRLAGFSSSGSIAALKRHSRRTDEFEEPPEDE